MQTSEGFRNGLNVNHWIGDNIAETENSDGWPYGASWFDQEDVAWIAAQGFDHLRIFVAGNVWISKDGDLDEAALKPFDDVLRWADAHGLGVVLAMDGLPGYRNGIRYGEPPTDVASPFTDEATRGDAGYVWWLVAKRYAGVGPGLRFQALASPNAESAAQIRAFNREVLAQIRRVSEQRVVYLTGRIMGGDALAEVELPDRYTALAISTWEPRVFSHQFDPRVPQIAFPGKVPDLAALIGDEADTNYSNTELTVAALDAHIDALAKQARAAAGDHEIYVSTFGALGNQDDASARTFIRASRVAFERNGLGWAVYDYNTGGAVRGEQGTAGPTRILEGLELKQRVATR